MMTKDKKPFTYTPGGIDLSQIKSPRMARRIERNAMSEGVSNTPKPSPLAQVIMTSFLFSIKLMTDSPSAQCDAPDTACDARLVQHGNARAGLPWRRYAQGASTTATTTEAAER